MATRKSNPPIRSSGRRPLDSIDSLHPSSLPPELGSLDMAWDDDPHSVGAIDLLQNSDLMDIDVDENERTTAVPGIPIDVLVRATMAEADARESAIDDLRVAVTVDICADKTVTSSNAQPADSVRHVVQDPWKSAPTDPLVASRLEEKLHARAADSIDTRKAVTSSKPHYAPYGGATSATAGKTPTFTPIAPKGPLQNDAPPSSTGKSRSLSVNPSEPVPCFDCRMTAPPTMPRANLAQLRNQMKDYYATGDFSGALELSEQLLRTDPGDLEAQRFVTSCRDVLTQMLMSRIGSLEQYVQISLSSDELRWLNLDHRAGFFLSLVDGTLTIEELLDISGMARLESLRILSTLLDQRVLRLAAH